MKINKIIILALSSIVLTSCTVISFVAIGQKNVVQFSLNNETQESQNLDNDGSYTATFYVDGSVYEQITYTKEDYKTKVAPELPSPKVDHFNYWYPNVDFSIFEDTKYDCMETLSFGLRHGGMKYSENEFISTADSTLGIYQNKQITDGTISTTLTKSVKTEDSGIVFGLTYKGDKKEAFWEDEDVSYYLFFYSQNNSAVLSKIDCGAYYPLVSKQTGLSDLTVDLKVSIDNGFIQCFVNDVCYIKYEETNMLSGNEVGMRLGKANSSFKNYVVSNIPEPEADDIPGFIIENGNASMSGNKITIAADNTLLLARKSPIYNREYRAAIVANIEQNVGMVFGYNDLDGSYYFYHINEEGYLVLSYFDGEAMSTIYSSYKLKTYSITKSYTFSIGFINNKVNCLLNGNIIYKYTNNETFVGTLYGFMSELKGSTITIM